LGIRRSASVPAVGQQSALGQNGYDTENNMVAITDAANHETQFSYDALGRVTQVTFPSSLSEGYTYDAMNNLLSKTDRNQSCQQKS
jgi:YD repeat-containing protein